MSRFFVGQRVRVVLVRNSFSDYWRVGAEGVITAIGSLHPAGRPSDCIVAVGLVKGHPTFDQIEPILPDGHRACDEEFKRDLDKLLEGLPA